MLQQMLAIQSESAPVPTQLYPQFLKLKKVSDSPSHQWQESQLQTHKKSILLHCGLSLLHYSMKKAYILPMLNLIIT